MKRRNKLLENRGVGCSVHFVNLYGGYEVPVSPEILDVYTKETHSRSYETSLV
jgi:hypothetical protein